MSCSAEAETAGRLVAAATPDASSVMNSRRELEKDPVGGLESIGLSILSVTDICFDLLRS